MPEIRPSAVAGMARSCAPLVKSLQPPLMPTTDQRPYKRPESVLVVVYTIAGEVLLLERTSPKGFRQSVTGSLRWGEGARDAAIRELYEETGLRAGGDLLELHHQERFPITPPWRARYAPNAHFNTEHWFALRLPTRRLIRLHPGEHRRYRWLAAAQAKRAATSWTNRAAIRRLLPV